MLFRSVQNSQPAAFLKVPQPQRVVLRPRKRAPAVGQHRRAEDRAVVTSQLQRHANLFQISQPQPALGEIVRRHGLPFEVVTDPGLALSRALGITYVFDDASRTAAEARGDRAEALNGIAEWELPKPTVIVVDQIGRAHV